MCLKKKQAIPDLLDIDPRKSESQLEAQWKILLADLRTGVASIVCMRYDNRSGASEHFRLVLGYDGKKDEVIYHEPAEKNDAYRRMKREKFIELWPLKYKKDQWLAIRMSLRMCVRSGTAILAVRFTRESSSWEKDQLQGQDDPATHGQAPRAPCGDAHATIERLLPPAIRGGKTTIAKSGGGFTDADYAQHIMKLKPTVPEGFTIVLQRPFVVVGDEPASVVGYRADRTVKWFVDRIGKLYFKKDPPKIYDIWLFKDDKSYRKNAEELFGDRPDTPFGYCSDAHGALVMNIATGGGTLCHEIVHAYIASNFPDCPAWFNEG